jgi:hypothetical protein
MTVNLASSTAFTFNPSPAESALLWMIREHESSQNYQATNPSSSAQGAYQFILSTWQMLCTYLGVSGYPTANSAPNDVQDLCALLLLRLVGPNSSESWQASGPYPTFAEAKGMLSAAGIANP